MNTTEKWLTPFHAARRSGAPIVILQCADYDKVVQEINKFYTDKEVALVNWDICRGVVGVNEKGGDAADLVNKNDADSPAEMVTANPVEALQRALKYLPDKSIMFMMNTQIIIESRDDNRIAVIQGIWNCRDSFKASGRTLVLLVPYIKVPAELANDVILLDVGLPPVEELATIVRAVYRSAGLPAPEEGVVTDAVNAISGLSEFSAEQVTSMAISRKGLDIESMKARKRSIIQQTGGLVVETRQVRFEDLEGLDQVKGFGRLINNGLARPLITCLLDEVDRQTAGINDSSGTGGDAYQQLLSNMQDRNWRGMVFSGVAGTGKTEMAHAIGSESGGLFIKMDLGGMLDKYVGESQKKIRSAMQTLWAMGGENVLFVATTNRVEAIRAEFMRRFSYGVYFFDTLSTKQQAPIWVMYMNKYGLPKQPLPSCVGWTGAEIKVCSRNAYELGITLIESAVFITPVARTMGEELVSLRKSANGKYLSANKPGFYTMAEAADADVEAAQNEIINL